MSSYTIEGSLIDARQIGPAVRVVISTQPGLNFPVQPGSTSNARRVVANQAVISRAGLDAWLPHYEETSGGATSTGRIACSAVSRPATYSGANLLTVLTFDLSSDALGSGDGVSIVADGNTVYGTDTSLYVAGDERWLAEAATADPGPGMSAEGAASTPGSAIRQRTDIYRFDITGPGPPRFAAGGSVPGYLIDQYALSQWQGYLRVAITTGTSWALADGPPGTRRPVPLPCTCCRPGARSCGWPVTSPGSGPPSGSTPSASWVPSAMWLPSGRPTPSTPWT